MQLGMIGLGRMGANMVRRLIRADHECVVFDLDSDAVQTLSAEGAVGASSVEDLAEKLGIAERHRRRYVRHRTELGEGVAGRAVTDPQRTIAELRHASHERPQLRGRHHRQRTPQAERTDERANVGHVDSL